MIYLLLTFVIFMVVVTETSNTGYSGMRADLQVCKRGSLEVFFPQPVLFRWAHQGRKQSFLGVTSQEKADPVESQYSSCVFGYLEQEVIFCLMQMVEISATDL